MINIIKHNYHWNGELRKRTSTDYVIFHHTESADNWTVDDIHRCHQIERGWIGIAYNLIVYQDGSIHEGRPIDMADADAVGYNNNSISVCFVGNFDKRQMTTAQVELGINILKWIVGNYPNIIPYRHKDVNPTSCPGKFFDDKIIVEGMKTMENITTVEQALDKFVEKGIINTKDYWVKVAGIVKYFDIFVINVANALK